MIVALQFVKENEQTIKDLLHSVKLDFKLFCSGSLAVVAESLMGKCSNCNKQISSEDAKDNEKMWILFTLNKKNDKLMWSLLETCSVKVETFKDISKFFDSANVQCRICIGKSFRKRSLLIEEPVMKTVDTIANKQVKRDSEGETMQTTKKPVNLRPRLVETALVKASEIAVRKDQMNINVVKKEDDSNSLAVETSNIEVTEDIKQEQQDERINEKVTVENMGSPNVKRARIVVIISEQKGEKKVNVGNRSSPSVKRSHIEVDKKIAVNQHYVNPNAMDQFDNSEEFSTEIDTTNRDSQEAVPTDLEVEKNMTSDSEASELDSDDSDFFNENRKRKKLTKKSLESSKCERPFKCVECGERYNQLSNLNRHVKASHRGEKPFECDVCEMKFTQKQNLIRHKRTHDGSKPYSCDLCEQKFSRKDSLNEHRWIHTGISGKNKIKDLFECPHCGRRCITKSILEIHLRIHTGEFPFQCLECGKKFNVKCNLNTHVKSVHRGIKPYECDICGRTFTQRSAMKIHRRTHLGMNEKQRVE